MANCTEKKYVRKGVTDVYIDVNLLAVTAVYRYSGFAYIIYIILFYTYERALQINVSTQTD